MDKGAHFYRCDFQVHSPRDTNWDGTCSVTPEERLSYAKELIQACRLKSIDAIAITDHHDFCFFPYIKTAAAEEVDERGNHVSKENQIIVFPGIELTLSSPACQVILLLDSDFDETKFNDILTTLTVNITGHSENKLPSVEPVSPDSVTSLNDLEDKLNQHKWLKGKFIILPNVTEGGHKNILREGFHPHYKEMRCVGGYVDGDYSRTSEGKKNILEGRQQNNGYKSIAVFQTSDNRKRDHSDLGLYSTYVKWSEPTAEALRQACLAKESRISLIEPVLPNLWITSISVSNSKFLGHIDIDFNRQYNAIIGGRGTGKSTILEYLRWGLCDQPVESEDIDIVQRKRKNLIDNTLEKFDGEVCVEFLLNGVLHIVKRNAKKQEILLKIAEGDFKNANEQEIRNLLPIQAYSQKQLSSVGVRIDELKRFVEIPIKQRLDQIKSKVIDVQSKMKGAYSNFIRMKQIRVEINEISIEIASLSKQLDKLRQSLKGLSVDDQKIIEQKTKYDEEESIIGELQIQLGRAKESVQSLVEFFNMDNTDVDNNENQEKTNEEAVENKEIIAEIRSKFKSKFEEIESGVNVLSAFFDANSLRDIQNAIKKWQDIKDAFDKKYEAAKAKAQVNQEQLEQIQTLEKRISILKKQQTEKRTDLIDLGDPEAQYKTLRTEWNNLYKEKLNTLEEQCKEFTLLSGGVIKAVINGSLDIVGITERIKIAFNGMNIREDKISKICQLLVESSDPFNDWNCILDELESLSLHTVGGTEKIPDTPLLSKSDFKGSELERIASQLDSERWVSLSVTGLEFNPKFQYCTNIIKAEYIEFADASAGQQATALLTALLNQNGAPLIIDQPEDDIDSKMVKDIVEQVWKSKNKRQLIFASHSANFVVNGDAELVVCCDYTKSGDQTHGTVKNMGAIDNVDIKEEITLVTEGGRQAFKLRMDKYGF